MKNKNKFYNKDASSKFAVSPQNYLAIITKCFCSGNHPLASASTATKVL
jgi:hypothetical protein